MEVTSKLSESRFERVDNHTRIIGAILIDEGRLTSEEADRIQIFASENRLRFGAAAVQLKLVSQQDVLLALATQFKSIMLDRGGSGGVDDEVIAAHDPLSEQVEQLRSLRSQLMLRWLPTASRKVLAIASPERGEGRSWLAANLATLFAQIGIRTLLIDANMREPRQHHLFNLGNVAGLSELLAGRALRQVTQRLHPRLRLFILPAGVQPPNPQELLSRPLFSRVIDRFAENFELTILDTPADLDFADAQVIAANAGSALLLARQDQTRCARLKMTLENMNQIGVSVIGSVFIER
jgi:chain length determinant protein tyrosine kinase EpsG